MVGPAYGHSAGVQPNNDDAPDENMLEQSESLDSDLVRNDDGDEVADPPEKWIPADDHRTLDQRIAEEEPDVAPGDIDPGDASARRGAVTTVSDDELDRMTPERHGRDAGQVDGTPEDGDSYYTIVE